MDMTPDQETQDVPKTPNAVPTDNAHAATRTPSIIVGIVAAVIVGLSAFYLLRPEPLLVQGEADAKIGRAHV